MKSFLSHSIYGNTPLPYQPKENEKCGLYCILMYNITSRLETYFYLNGNKRRPQPWLFLQLKLVKSTYNMIKTVQNHNMRSLNTISINIIYDILVREYLPELWQLIPPCSLLGSKCYWNSAIYMVFGLVNLYRNAMLI